MHTYLYIYSNPNVRSSICIILALNSVLAHSSLLSLLVKTPVIILFHLTLSNQNMTILTSYVFVIIQLHKHDPTEV